MNLYHAWRTAVGTAQFESDPGLWDIEGLANPKNTNLIIWDFKVLGLEQQLHVGDHVDVYWSAFNRADAVYQPAGGFIMYVACMGPNQGWYDFGHKSETVWVQRPNDAAPDIYWNDVNWLGNGNPGGGDCMYQVSSGILNQAGTWRFIADIYQGGQYMAWYAGEVDLVVNA